MQILSVLNALKIKLNVKFACAKHFEQKMSKTLKTKGVKVELTGEQTEEIRKGFKIYDLENTNKIDVNDLKGALRACGFEPKKEEIKQIAKSLKSDEEGKITFEQFVGVISSRMTEKDTKEEIMKAFRLFDDDETGRISVTNLKRVAKELGETITDDELKEMITEADINGDGEVDSEEFYKIMKKTSLY